LGFVIRFFFMLFFVADRVGFSERRPLLMDDDRCVKLLKHFFY